MSSHDQAQPAQDPANPLPEKQVDTISAKNLESNIRVALQSLVPSGGQRAQRFSEELAILKRWYYRTHKVGETFFVNDRGELPLRRMARGATRVYRGEKETPALPTVEEQQPS
jgi:hypothetical protein